MSKATALNVIRKQKDANQGVKYGKQRWTLYIEQDKGQSQVGAQTEGLR